MKISDIISELDLAVLNQEPIDLETEIENGYTCDLLSQVLASAKGNSVWITIQSHLNIIGVATMAGIKAVIISENHEVPAEVVSKADEEKVALLRSGLNSYTISGKLFERGIR